MKYILLASLLVLTACGSAPSRCNQKKANIGYIHMNNVHQESIIA